MKISLKRPDGSCCCGSRYRIVGGCWCRDACSDCTETVDPCSLSNVSLSPGGIYVLEESQIPEGCCGGSCSEARAVILDAGGFAVENDAIQELNTNYEAYKSKLDTSCEYLELTVEYGTCFATNVTNYYSYPLPYSPGDLNYTFNRRVPRGSETILIPRTASTTFEYTGDAGAIKTAYYYAQSNFLQLECTQSVGPPAEWLEWLSSDGTSFVCPEGYKVNPDNTGFSVILTPEETKTAFITGMSVLSWPSDCNNRSVTYSYDPLIPCQDGKMSDAAVSFYGTAMTGSASVYASLAMNIDWHESRNPCYTLPGSYEGEDHTYYFTSNWFDIDYGMYIYGTLRHVRNEV